MSTYPFHPAGLFPGGVSIEQNQVVVRDETGAALAQANLPSGILPDDLYRLGRLFDLFPEAEWCVGRPWQAAVELQLIRLDRQRLVDGAITFKVNGQDDGPYAWAAEICYSEQGPVWDIDVPLPEDHVPTDFGLRLALGAVVYSLIAGPPAAGRPGETTTVLVGNAFSREGLLTRRPYRTRRLTSPLADLSRLFAAEISRQFPQG